MLLNSIQVLSSFPFEKVGVFINETISPETSSRLGVRFRNTKYYDGLNLLNFNPSLNLYQSGLEHDLLYVPGLSSYYNSTQTKKLTQPTNFVNLPGDFPSFIVLSAISNNDVLLNFRGGLSAITLFPTRAFPIITKLSDSTISVSATLLPISAFNYNITINDYYKNLNLNSLKPLSSATLSSPSIFDSNHKNDFLWKKITSNALVNDIFINETFPASRPYDTNILPDSFKITIPIGLPSDDFPYLYPLSYAYTLNNKHYLSGLTIETLPQNPIFSNAYISSNLDNTFGLTMSLNSNYVVPKNSEILVSYETKNDALSTISTKLSTNNYSISSSIPPYLHFYQFALSSIGNITTDAITIYYSPSAIVTSSGATSAVLLSTVMEDNYYQTSFPINLDQTKAQLRFIESSNDVSLSAIDLATNNAYISNTWMPASGNFKFINDGNANFHSISYQLSTFNNSIYNYGPNNFILNKEKAQLNVFISESSETSAKITGSLFPTYDTTLPIKWSVYPPDNITLYDTNSLLPIDLNSETPAGSLEVSVNNLGVDKTTITIYSSEFDIYASTVWYPTSSIGNNISLTLSAIIDDFKYDSRSTLSALVIKNNLYYPVPVDGFITWTEIYNSPDGFFQFNSNDNQQLLENSTYNSSRNYTNINIELSTRKVAENPQLIPFNINTHFFNNLYDIRSNKTIYAREYPLNANIYASLTASDGRTFDTRTSNSIYFISTVSITAHPLTSDFSRMDFSSIYWNTPSGIINSPSVIFSLSGDYCLGLIALSAQPAYGGFDFYSFENNICMDILDSTSGLNFIAFPEYQFNPTNKLSLNDNSYLNSVGITGISSCVSQNFILSTFGGFDEYHYSIGNVLKISNSPIETMSVSYNNVTSSSAISISAFNRIFRKNDPLTIHNYVSSPDTNIFNSFVKFNQMALLSANLSADNVLFDTKLTNTTFFNTELNFPPIGIDVHQGTMQYILSSNHEIKYSDLITFNNDYITTNERFTKNPFDLYSIDRNTFDVFNYFVSGNINRYIKGFDFCDEPQTFISNIISLTAYDGYYPELELFVQKNIYKTNEIVYFHDQTPTNFTIPFSGFIFNDGNSHIQSTNSASTILTGVYSSEGVYNVTLSGIYDGFPTQIRTWNELIIVKDDYEIFDPSINRKFPDALKMPISQKSCQIPANSWHYADTLNKSFKSIKTNIEYLSSMAYSYETNIPKYFIGYAGEKDGVLSWNYNNSYSTNFPDEIISLKDILVFDDKIILINGNSIEIRNNDYYLTKIYSGQYITEGEKFINPSGMAYNSQLNKLIILDNTKKLVYVFDLNSTLLLTHYWGGEGERESRTKLNNPTDIISDHADNILIVDSDSLSVKIYNKYLNWITAINYSGWTDDNKPLSITGDSLNYYILTTTGEVGVFDLNYQFIYSFNTIKGTKIYSNNDHEGLIYVVSDWIYVYSKNGVFINHIANIRNVKKLAFHNNEIYAISDNIIYKFIDFISTQSVKNNYLNSYYWDWSSIFIKNGEPLTDFVLNDSFKKIHDNILILSKEIQSKFVDNIDEFDLFSFQSLSSIHSSEICLISSNYIPIGVNESATYDIINRNIDNIYYDLSLLQCMLEVRTERVYTNGSNICWTWESQSINGPQHPNDKRRPFSWYELRSEMSIYNPLLSGITWSTAKSCNSATNDEPICWTWEGLEHNNCNIPITWGNTEYGNIYEVTWAEIENKYCASPQLYFDNCASNN